MQVIHFFFFLSSLYNNCSVWKAKEVFCIRKAHTKYVEKSTHCFHCLTVSELGVLV